MPAAKKTTKKSATKKAPGTFSAEERAAMKERAAELRSSGKGKAKAQADAQAVLDAIAAMAPADRALAKKVHTLVTKAAPELAPKTWYGMPSYAKDGKIVCFFQAAGKFKSRYSTLGFEADASLDDGTMWPTAFALTKLSKADEATITMLVKKAVG